jgi:hypothetical protein
VNEKQDSSIRNDEYDDYVDDFENEEFLLDNVDDTRISQNSIPKVNSVEKLLKDDLIKEQSAKITSRHSVLSDHQDVNSDHEIEDQLDDVQSEPIETRVEPIETKVEPISKADAVQIISHIKMLPKEVEIMPSESQLFVLNDAPEEPNDSDEIILEPSKIPLNIETKESSNITLEIIDSQSEKEDSDSGSDTIELNSDAEEPEYFKSVVKGNNIKSSFLIKLEVQNKKVKRKDINLRITTQGSGSRKRKRKKRNVLTDQTETDSVVESRASNKVRLGSRKLRFSDKYKYHNQTVSDKANTGMSENRHNINNNSSKLKSSHIVIVNKNDYQRKCIIYCSF